MQNNLSDLELPGDCICRHLANDGPTDQGNTDAVLMGGIGDQR